MPSARTFITEVTTGLGMLGGDDVARALGRRSPELPNLDASHWDQLDELWQSRRFTVEFESAFRNGVAFLRAPDALNGRRPRLIEWTGGRRAPGDEVVPADLRVDHVYLVSCKYLSRILHNPSPSRLFEALLAHGPAADDGDWYQRVAPQEYQGLYEACAPFVEGNLPLLATDLAATERRRLAVGLRSGWPAAALAPYGALCQAVATRTAEAWSARLTSQNLEPFVWRLFRIGSAPYFILGASPRGSTRLRIDTPWDWRQRYRLRDFTIAAQPGGQPRVGWTAVCQARATGQDRVIDGHVEIRWSHGRFGGRPEAKVYLDVPPEAVPGYHPL